MDDDGAGFDPATVPAGTLGIAGMRARAEQLGGRLVVRSRPGRGSRIEVVVPLRARRLTYVRHPRMSIPEHSAFRQVPGAGRGATRRWMAAEPDSGGALRVLLVDADHRVRECLRA